MRLFLESTNDLVDRQIKVQPRISSTGKIGKNSCSSVAPVLLGFVCLFVLTFVMHLIALSSWSFPAVLRLTGTIS